MEAVALSGMELTLVPPEMVPRLRVVLGLSGSGVRAIDAERDGQCGDGIGRAGIGEAVAAGTVDGDLEAQAAESLSDGGVCTRAIEHDVGGDASGECGLFVEVAYAAQIAFTLFAYVAENDNWNGELDLGMDDGLRESEQADDAGGIVACSGSDEAIGAVFARKLRD